MKFKLIQQVVGGGRLGVLSDFERLPDLVVDTPTCLLYTRHGQVPGLTEDIVAQLERAPKLVNCPLTTIIKKTELLQLNGKGLADLIKMKDRALWITQTDSTEPYQENGSTKTSVSVWTSAGRARVTSADLARCVHAAQPEAVQMLTDNETCTSTGDKKSRKSVDRTIDYLDNWLAVDPKVATETPVLLSIAGGYSLRERKSCIEKLSGSFAAGYVLDGFRGPTETPLSMTLDGPALPVVAECCRLLPSNLPRLLATFGQPADVAKAVSLGVDLFDGTFPYMLCQRQIAWLHRPIGDGQMALAQDDWLSVKNNSFLTDSTPLQSDCDCFACRKHTRAYICHLLITKELLGNILLMIHNSHQYFLFFEELRTAIRNEKLEQFVQWASTIRFVEDNKKVCDPDPANCDGVGISIE